MTSSFEEWEKSVPALVRRDPVWQSLAYPKALFLYDLVWEDCQKLWNAPMSRALADQVIRSTGSISANLEEGFGRGVQHKAYDQLLRYSLGSARETKGWYFRSHHILPEDTIKYRMELIEEIISLLTSTINRRRNRRDTS